jgi:hypothetical protein
LEEHPLGSDLGHRAEPVTLIDLSSNWASDLVLDLHLIANDELANTIICGYTPATSLSCSRLNQLAQDGFLFYVQLLKPADKLVDGLTGHKPSGFC